MNGIYLDKGEALVTDQIGLSGEGFIVSVRAIDSCTFVLHIKIRTDRGDFYNIAFPLERLRRFKGII